MSVITLENISISFSDKPILDNISAVISKYDKIALIGRNGEGKSTLMRIIAKQITADDGKLKIKNNTIISYLEQTLTTDNDKNLFNVVAQGLGEKGNLLIRYNSLIKQQNIQQASILQEEIDTLNAWQYIPKINSILDKFKLNPDDTLSTLSGGLIRKLMLAKALIQEPDVLLLDEPTNHMDISSIINLEKILKDFHATLVLISHDRSFVANIVNKVFDLDRSKLSIFECGYKEYVNRKAININSEELANARFNKKLAQEEVWIRQGIKARRTRNEGRVRALQEMRKTFVNYRKQRGNVKIHTPLDNKYNSKIVFEVKNISYSIAGNKIIQDFSTLILKGEKIGIIGANGVGKSTLIKLLLGELNPDSGNIRRSKTIKLAYFDQMQESLDPNMLAMDFVAEGRERVDIGGKSMHIIGYLRQFLFTGKQAMAPIRMFSGGEKNRLMLAKILSKSANLLILDEPTNDLDVETLELLEEMLLEYNATLIVISHDRTFLNNIASSTIVMQQNGEINQYAGGYDDYLIQNQPEKQKNKVKNKPAIKINKNLKLSYKQKLELDGFPIKIEELEGKITNIQTQISKTDFYQQDNYQDTLTELSKLEEKLTKLYYKWNELEKQSSNN